MAYGIANSSGKPSESAACELVSKALHYGVHGFDTAAAYGESERVLGRALAQAAPRRPTPVVSKGTLAPLEGKRLRSRVEESLGRLGIPSLEAWLIHDEKELDSWSQKTKDELEEVRREGLIRNVGISVYSPQIALSALEQRGLRAVQFPGSPLDRRFFKNQVAARLAATNATLYVRSVFLQGLCLMRPDAVPAHISRAKAAVSLLDAFCRKQEFDRDYFCLHYVLHRTRDLNARIVIGLDNISQLERLDSLLLKEPPEAGLFDAWDEQWPYDPEELVLPYLWNRR